MSAGREDLWAVTAALDTLLERGRDLIGPGHLDEAAELRVRIDERLRHGDALTVVAVAGGTGAGKSAITNRLVGEQVATEGVRRPTTDHPVAVAAGFDDGARALLDHLGIHDRRTVGERLPQDLILVDLPDHDSVVESHRTTATRLAGRVDVLVVVVDPVKYARADLHHGPLADLTRHADVVTVALNRTDEVAADEVQRLRLDLAAKLAADGLGDVEIVTTSAATGEGIRELRAHVEQLAAGRSAAARRLIDDAAQLADRIAADAGEPAELRGELDALIGPLVEATGADRTATAAAIAYRRVARRRCRSPLARTVGLVGRLGRQLREAFVPARPQPPPPGRSVSAIEAELSRQLALSQATGREHAALATSIDRIARDAAPRLVDAVEGVRLEPPRRAWWTLAASLRGIAEAIALVGFVWLVLLGLGEWLQLPEIPTPEVTEALSWPTALLLGGVLLRVLFGIASRLSAAAGARRHARRVSREVRRRLTEALQQHVAAPVEAELQRRRTVRNQVALLASGGAP